MPKLRQTSVSLRIFGDNLVPATISTLMEAEPTDSRVKGESVSPTGKVRQRTGAWFREAADRTPGDLDAQIREILEGLTSDIGVWQELTGRFACDIYCGLFMESEGDGLELQPETIALLGDRGLRLNLQLYAPVPEEPASDDVGDGSR